MSCAKTVIDFTAMLPEEVQHFSSKIKARISVVE
jgi:hypothetical protein